MPGIAPSYEELKRQATAPDTPMAVRQRAFDLMRRLSDAKALTPVAVRAGLAQAMPQNVSAPDLSLAGPSGSMDWSNPSGGMWTGETARIEGQQFPLQNPPPEEPSYDDNLREKNAAFRGWAEGIPGRAKARIMGVLGSLSGPAKEAEGKASVQTGVDPQVDAAWGGLGQQASQTFPLTESDYAAAPVPEAKPAYTDPYADATTVGTMPPWAMGGIAAPAMPEMPALPEPKGLAAATEPADKQSLSPATAPAAEPAATQAPADEGWLGEDGRFALLAAGLGILGADPRRGLLGAIGEGGMAALNAYGARRAERRQDERYAQERKDKQVDREFEHNEKILDRNMRTAELQQRMGLERELANQKYQLAQFEAEQEAWKTKMGLGVQYAQLGETTRYHNAQLGMQADELGLRREIAAQPGQDLRDLQSLTQTILQRGDIDPTTKQPLTPDQAEQKALSLLHPKTSGGLGDLAALAAANGGQLPDLAAFGFGG